MNSGTLGRRGTCGSHWNKDLISLQSGGNIHITTHHLCSCLFILLLHCLSVCVCVYLVGWLGCLAQECPETAPARACLQTRPEPGPPGHLFSLGNGASCPRYQDLSPGTARPQVIYHPWHHRNVLIIASYFHGDRFCYSFQLLRGGPLPRARTSLTEQDFAESLSSPNSEHLTRVSTMSSLKCCSTQRAALSPSITKCILLLFSLLFVWICSHHRLATASKVQKGSESNNFLWEDLVQLYNNCWHWANDLFHINANAIPNANYLWLEYFLYRSA